jgi:3-oxoacyl-[acyl-carrier protein] reductase
MSKVALIFGGTGGIGQAIGADFEKRGITVYLTSHNRFEKTQDSHILHCDITKNKDIKNVISYILKKEGEIDIVVNCVTPPLKLKPIENLSLKEFKEDTDTILIGGININRAIISTMKNKRSGIIINILSELVLGRVSSRMSSYISAKYGLFGFTKCLAVELAPFNVFVFGISPSYVETNLIKVLPNKLIEIERSKRKSKKLIQPVEVAKVVLRLVQNPQKYKTGDNIEIN